MSELFPEVDGLEDEAARPSGGVREARPGEKAALQRMLGLPGPFAGAFVARATAQGSELRVQIESPRTGNLGLIVGDGGQRGATASGPGLSLRYVGTQLSPTQQRLLNHIAAHSRGLSFAGLAALFKGPEKTELSPPDDETSVAFSYASEAGWRTFFEGKESYRGYCGTISGRVATVHHADNECTASGHDIHNGTMNFFHFLRNERPARPDPRSVHMETDLEDLDVIKGGDRKLDEVLDLLTGHHEPLDAVFVMSTCISLVTGDDMDGAAAKLERKLRLPVISVGNSINPHAELFRLLRQRPGFLKEADPDGYYNLVGLPPIPGHQELIDLLADSGARLRAWLLPSVDVDQMATYHAARVQVLYPCAWQAEGYKPMLQGIDLPTIQPPAPFGFEGSRRWLEAIAAAVDRGPGLAGVLSERLAALTPRWEELRASARELTLGLIVDDPALAKLRDPSQLLGVPLVPVLREMGFQLEFFRYAPPGVEVRAATQEGGAVRILPFATPAELEARLRASPALAFYSDIAFDRRLTRLGKNVFSLRDLELGPAGAVRTLHRLLNACRLPFYRKYSRYLGRPFSARLEGAS